MSQPSHVVALYKATKLYDRPEEYRHGNMTTAPVITVTAALHNPCGNARPSFSVTGEVKIPGRRDFETGGCIHREILRHWPELAPIVALHLSDSDGAPMHAEANGWYQLAGALGGLGERYHAGNSEGQHWNADGSFDGYRLPTADECLESFARHCRIDKAEAADIRIRVRAAEVRRNNITARELARESRGRFIVLPPTPREVWRGICESMRERWQREATAGVALIRQLTDAHTVARAVADGLSVR